MSSAESSSASTAESPLEAASTFGEATGPDSERAPPGNPPRLVRGGVTFAIGAVGAVLLMSLDRQLRLGVPLGFLFSLIASIGVIDLAGMFDDDHAPVASRVSIDKLVQPLVVLAIAIASFLGALGLSVHGYLPALASAVLVPGTLLGTIAAVFRLGVALGGWSTDGVGEALPLHRRHGFWLMTIGTLLFFPAAGHHSLSDPWETHYGEVAREILSRNDWISLWWAQDGWFWSKPVLDFWIQSIAMATLGVGYLPDQMLAPDAAGRIPWPEWAVRTPVVLMALLAVYLLYKGVANVFGRRAGFIGGVVLMTMPQWAFLTHQTMTDMPFVAAMTCAMGLLLLGIHTNPDRKVSLHEVEIRGTRIRLSALHLVFGAILIVSLPQVFYLVSRQIDLVTLPDAPTHGFRLHVDQFWSGSKGNCGLPGNEACAIHRAQISWFQPALQGLVWSALLGVLVYINRGERRVQRLCYMAAFFFAAISTMGKGPAGVVLPVLCALAYVVVTGRWRDLSRMELLSGALIVLVVAMPWYVAMYARHGSAFVDRLIFHDMWKRALTHVHDTNEGDDVSFRFYVWQLGYACFPWTGIVPAALLWWARKPDDADRGKGDASVFLAMWFVFAFALFTAMLTKFHHYIFPAVPPAAMLTGIWLDRITSDLSSNEERKESLASRALSWALVGSAGALLALAIGVGSNGSIDGHVASMNPTKVPPPNPGLSVLFVLISIVLFVVGAMRLKSSSPAVTPNASAKTTSDSPDGAESTSDYREAPERTTSTEVEPIELRYERLITGAAALGGALVVGVVGRDMVTRLPGDIVGGARLLHLFTYNYKRLWPESLDFGAAFWGATIAAVICTLLIASQRLRKVGVGALAGLAIGFTVWGIDVYFVRTSPHWGQREIIQAYYENRTSPREPLVGYQMNWKGETFYSGNHLPAFPQTGDNFKSWIRQQRDLGVNTFFFVSEHARLNGLKGELGNPADVKQLTDKVVNNKFTVVRVQFELPVPIIFRPDTCRASLTRRCTRLHHSWCSTRCNCRCPSSRHTACSRFRSEHTPRRRSG